MSRKPVSRILQFVALAVLLGACAKPPPVPSLSLLGRNCVDKPDLNAASPVPLADDKPVSVTLDDTTPCLNVGGGTGKAAYVAFSLPQTGDEYILSVNSVPVGDGRFSPRLALLDTGGNKLRDIPADMFMAHGASLHAGLRPHPGEHYLIVSSDPDTIGQSESHIADGTQASVSSAGRFFVTVHTGYEGNVTLTNAYNGTVTVAAQPIPKAK